MSAPHSPAHTLDPKFDGSTLYGSDFIAEISNKMRVPDKISVAPSDNKKGVDFADLRPSNIENYAWMHVPERILVVGNEKHAAGEDIIPELRMENSVTRDKLSLAESMPTPQSLTAEHRFPIIDSDSENDVKPKEPSSRIRTNSSPKKRIGNGYKQNRLDDISSSDESPEVGGFHASFNNLNQSGSSLDEFVILRRQMKMLSRRLSAIESENQARYQREMLMYSFGFMYIVFKGILWLKRSW